MPRTLRRIAGCESNGQPDAEINWTAANRYSTASGGFEDLDSTWQNWSARFRDAIISEIGQDPTQWGRAMYAPPEVQLKVNLHAYLEDGTSPWTASRSCWAG